MQLPEKHILGQWMYEKPDIWQMKLLDERGLDSFARSRGLMPFFMGEHIKVLWRLGLLYADLVVTSETIDLDGLMYLGSGPDQKYYYADERQIQPFSAGVVGTASKLSDESCTQLQLLFHPFRYYVLYHIDRMLKIRATPFQMLYPSKAYERILTGNIESFNVFSTTKEFTEQILLWNRVSALASAVEPCFFERLFQVLSKPARRSFETQEKMISEHWETVKQCFLDMGIDQLETYRRELTIAAEMLDPNKNVHILLRLISGKSRIDRIKGNLGGAMILLSMAEMIRRSTEKAFDVELLEEDELGFGSIVSDFKEKNYGSKRILDGNASVKTRWLQSFGLDSGARLRWYVEGDTEYYALTSVFGDYIAIDLVNLRGQVTAGKGKGVGFRDNLRSDIKTMVFSFISFDGDVSDNLRAAKKAAKDDEICGMFFVSMPDFEFQNFSLTELEEIFWQIAQDRCQTLDFNRAALRDAIQNTTNAKELFSAVSEVSSCFYGVEKGEEWGKRLIAYAGQNPKMSGTKSTDPQSRQILDAINHAIRTAHLEYQPSRDRNTVDPNTGMPIAR